MSWPIGEKIVGIGGGKDEYGNWIDATLTLERGPKLTIGLITHRKLVETQNALKLALSRDTGDPSHNWLECEQLSCVMGRKALGIRATNARSASLREPLTTEEKK